MGARSNSWAGGVGAGRPNPGGSSHDGIVKRMTEKKKLFVHVQVSDVVKKCFWGKPMFTLGNGTITSSEFCHWYSSFLSALIDSAVDSQRSLQYKRDANRCLQFYNAGRGRARNNTKEVGVGKGARKIL